MNLKELADKFKSKLTLNSLQCKVRDVTSYEEFGPTTQEMRQIVDAMAESPTNFNDICYVLWKRLFEDIENDWVRVYKSLKLLHYLILHGESRFIDEARRHVSSLRMNLIHYTCLDRDGRDQGINVRSRVCEVLDLLSNDTNLRQERTRAWEIRSKVGHPLILSTDKTSHHEGVFSSAINSFRRKTSTEKFSDSPWCSNNFFSDTPSSQEQSRTPTSSVNKSIVTVKSPVATEGDLLGFDCFPTETAKGTEGDLLVFEDFGDFVSHQQPTKEPDWGDFVEAKKTEKPVSSFDPFADIVQSLNRH